MAEYREVRSRVSFLELCRNPELCAEVTLQPIDAFGLDAAILFSDILVVFDAMGVQVDFTPAPIVTDPIRDGSGVQRLRWGDPLEEVSYVMDAVRACKRALAGRVPLIGFAGAPFTVLSYLVEGKGSRDFEHTKGLLFREPKVFHHLMERLTDLLGRYLEGQVAAGADAVQIFDSWAGALTPHDYANAVLPHFDRLVRRLKATGVPVIAFARGNANLLEVTRSMPADVVGIDWSIELDRAIDVVGRDRVVQGNLDPMVLLGTPELLVERTKRVLAQGRQAKAHVFNLGHGISRFTDPRQVALLVETVHAGITDEEAERLLATPNPTSAPTAARGSGGAA